jgi:hypothetical protein
MEPAGRDPGKAFGAPAVGPVRLCSQKKSSPFMVEGESGLLAVHPQEFRPLYEACYTAMSRLDLGRVKRLWLTPESFRFSPLARLLC